MSNREQLITAALGWIGTPFHHEARVKGHGVDCLQLLVAVYQEAGFLPDDFHVEPYAFDEHLHDDDERYLRGLEESGFVRTETPQPGDIAMFKIGKRYSHGAIVVEYPLCLHSYIRQGVGYVDADNDAELVGRKRLFYTIFKDDQQ